MSILDHAKITDADTQGSIPHSDIPAFSPKSPLKYVPNPADLRAGDLLLSAPVKPGIVAHAIAATQNAATHVHHTWSHVGIYVGDWRLIEATPQNGISSDVLTSWVADRRILVRRPAHFAQLPDHEAIITGLKMAIEASLHLGHAKYSVKSAIGILGRLRAGARSTIKLEPPPETQSASLICSGLYARCYAIGANQPLQSPEEVRTSAPITPAKLAGTAKLVDVEVGWLKLT